MIPVSNSKVIEFINWIERRNNQVYLKNMEYTSLLHLANDFLEEKKNNPLKKSECLKFILQLYQTLPQEDADPVNRMNHFCRFTFKNRVDWTFNLQESLDPFLKSFVMYANSIGYKQWFENEVYEYFGQRESITEVIYPIMSQTGFSLVDVFERYCNQVGWRKLEKFQSFLNDTNRRSENNRYYYNDKDQADGLAQAIGEMIDGGFYDEILAKNEKQSNFLSAVAGLSADLVQGLTFVEWIMSKEPSINLLGNIPNQKLEQWSKEFCDIKGYGNTSEFTRDIKKLLNSKKPFNRISNRIMAYSKKRSPHLQARDDVFARYDEVYMHGMFIFAPKHNLASFIESNWRNFNFILGDEIDVYYSIEDLKGRSDLSIDQYNFVNINVSDLPAFIFWGKSMNDNTLISFGGLNDHNDIAEVFENVIVEGIRNEESALEIKRNADTWRKQRIEENKLKMYRGGLSMNIYNGQNFVNNGQKMVVKKNTISQNNGVNESVDLDANDISALKRIVETLKRSNNKELAEELALQGASIISGLIKANDDKDDEVKSTKLKELASWKEKIGEKGLRALAIIADVTTLTIPVLSLLGLQT